jgi:hypothetical protein
MTKEKRSSERKSTSIWVKELRGDYFFLRNATNLSNGGMYIDNASPVDSHGNISYIVHLPSKKEIKFKGKIVHSKNDDFIKGYGIEFLNFEKGSSTDLLEVL